MEKALAFFEPSLGKSTKPRIAVFNTLNWQRTDMAELFIPYEVIPSGEDFTITDDVGREVPVHVFKHEVDQTITG